MPAAPSPISCSPTAVGDVKLFKALSTPADPTRAIENGLRLLSEDLGAAPAEIVANCDLCINGTTVGLNALITHKGGKTGLICTAGHEDSIEIRHGHKEDGYRYDPEYPRRGDAGAALPAQRRARAGDLGRHGAHGARTRRMCAPPASSFSKEGVETVAVSFVWSVLNPAHERRAAEIVREMMPNVDPDRRQRALSADPRIHAHLDGGDQCLSGAGRCSRYVAAVDRYFQQARRQAAGALFPVERRSRDRPGDDRPLGLRDQFRPGLGAAGRPLRRRAVQARRTSSPSTWAAPPSTSR